MAVFYNYIKGCGQNATMGTENVSTGQSLKGTSGWHSVSDHWVFLKWQDNLYYNKNGDAGVADFRDARNNPKIYFNNVPNYPGSDSRQLSTGRVITSEARNQEMFYDLTFKDGPAVNSASHTVTRETKFEQTTNYFFTYTSGFKIQDSSNDNTTVIYMEGKRNDETKKKLYISYPVQATSSMLVGISGTNKAVFTIPEYSKRFDDGLDVNGRVTIYNPSSATNTSPILDCRGWVRLGANSEGNNCTASFPSSSGTKIEFSKPLEISGTNTYCKAPYFNATSDKRAKENIRKSVFSALAIVNSLPIYNFNYKDSDKPSIGVMAQEALQYHIDDFSLVENEEATGENNDYMSIKESKLIYILWKAIQEQQEEIELLKTQLRGDR